MLRNHLSIQCLVFFANTTTSRPYESLLRLNYLEKMKDHAILRRKQNDLPTAFYVQDSRLSTKYHGYNLANTGCEYLLIMVFF